MPERTLTPDESKRFAAMLAAGKAPTPDELLFAETTPEEREFADTATAAALGGGYRLADLDLKLVAGHFPLLYLVDSPLVSGDPSREQAIGLVDIATALYILAEGERAVQPLMDVQGELAAVQRAEAIAKTSPAHMDAYLDRLSALERRRRAFTADALRFYRAHVAPGQGALQELTDLLVAMINDSFEAAGSMSGAAEKKTAPPSTTCSGWRNYWPPWRALRRAFTRLTTSPGTSPSPASSG